MIWPLNALKRISSDPQHLQKQDGAYGPDSCVYYCTLCDYSTKARLNLVQHARSARHQQNEGLRKLQLHQQGLGGDEDGLSLRELFQVKECPSSQGLCLSAFLCLCVCLRFYQRSYLTHYWSWDHISAHPLRSPRARPSQNVLAFSEFFSFCADSRHSGQFFFVWSQIHLSFFLTLHTPPMTFFFFFPSPHRSLFILSKKPLSSPPSSL